MASKASPSVALFLTFNLLFFTGTTAWTPSPSSGKCPINAFKLAVCANVLNLIKAKAGMPPKVPCCSLLGGLVNLEAKACLCTAIKGNVLGINLNLPIDLSLILNYCGKGVPSGFRCP